MRKMYSKNQIEGISKESIDNFLTDEKGFENGLESLANESITSYYENANQYVSLNIDSDDHIDTYNFDGIYLGTPFDFDNGLEPDFSWLVNNCEKVVNAYIVKEETTIRMPILSMKKYSNSVLELWYLYSNDGTTFTIYHSYFEEEQE